MIDFTPPGGEPEVILETFEGYVTKIEDVIAYIDLKSKRNGDRFYAQYPMDKLVGIVSEEGDQFLVHTVAKGEWTRLRFEKVEPREITYEEAQEIHRKIEADFPIEDPGVEY